MGDGKKRSWWPIALVAAFVVHASILAITMTLASKTPANAEPDYYDKALAWDEQAAALRTPEREGWDWTAHATGETLRVELRDASAAPIPDASMSATVFHHANAGQRRTIELVAAEPGIYEAPAVFERAGVWEVRLSVLHGEARGAMAQTVEID